MSVALSALLAVVSMPSAVFVQDGVEIAVAIESHIYFWTVKNGTARPIRYFQIELHSTYDQHAPDGWQIEMDGPQLRAWADDQQDAIAPGESGIFSARVSSRGAVLGLVAASSGSSAKKPDVHFDQVWGPVPRPRSAVALVAVTVAAIGLLHVWLIVRIRRRRAARAASGA